MRYKKFMLFTILALISLFLLEAVAQKRVALIAEPGSFEFRHTNGAIGKKYFIEPLGSGVALFDFDNDADLDIYFVNGTDLTPSEIEKPPVLATNLLYRNDSRQNTRNSHAPLELSDVTHKANVGDTRYGFGCCVGDYNNDGFTDLYVTNYGTNVLYRNNGDGTFTDVTEDADVGGKGQLSTGCAFIDYDADGFLDLYVVNYVQFTFEANPHCSRRGIPTYCTPEVLPSAADILYRNNGNGTFTDVTANAGIALSPGKGLGVVCGDINSDGTVDIFVANDTTPNFLYWNNGDGTFTEDALFAGVALSEEGRAYSGMGANLGDFDNDGNLDIVITNFQEQTNSLYHNTQNGFFTEVSFQKGIGEKSLRYLAWGVDFIDFDNDGWLDVFIANGHLDDNVAEIHPIGTYAQPNQLFLNNRGLNFQAITPVEQNVYSSRGAAFGDIDNDGDIDVVVSNLNKTSTLLRNTTGNIQRWLQIQLVGNHCNRSAIGARVTVSNGNLTQIREVKSGSGYLSQNDLRLHFGLGDAESVNTLTVRWPCGQSETWQNIKTNQILVVKEN